MNSTQLCSHSSRRPSLCNNWITMIRRIFALYVIFASNEVVSKSYQQKILPLKWIESKLTSPKVMLHGAHLMHNWGREHIHNGKLHPRLRSYQKHDEMNNSIAILCLLYTHTVRNYSTLTYRVTNFLWTWRKFIWLYDAEHECTDTQSNCVHDKQ